MSQFEIVVPSSGESVTEADIASWNKANGEWVDQDDILLELETDKASLEITAETSGILTIIRAEGETVEVGSVIGKIVEDKSAAPKAKAPAQDATQPAPDTASSASVESIPAKASTYATGHPSPAAAKQLAEKNIDSADVKGTGPGGRILKQDVDQVSAKPTSSGSDPVSTPVPEQSTSSPGSREQRREKMSRLRRTISTRLVAAQQGAALLTTFNEVDMQAIMDIRTKYKESFKEKYQVGLGFMSFFTKAVCEAIQLYPVINASVDNDHIVYHDYCDVGIAVSTPKGLVVPVIRNAETLSFSGIESTILNLALRGRDGKLTPEDMAGGTFTITNGGTFGSMLSTPIVNRPQSAILGMHNIVKRPTVVNGEIVIRPIMYLAITYDHRIIDGSEAVRFLVAIKERIEDPTRLLLGI